MCARVSRQAYSSPSSRPWLDVGAPPSIDGTPAGGAAFVPEDLPRPLLERLAADLPGPVLPAFGAARLALFLADFFAPAFLATFFAALRFGAAFFAVLAAGFFAVLVFFAVVFFAAFFAAI